MSQNTAKNATITALPTASEVLTYSTRWSRLDGNVLLSDEFRGLRPGAQAVYGYLSGRSTQRGGSGHEQG